jgi:hypothetical protein
MIQLAPLLTLSHHHYLSPLLVLNLPAVTPLHHFLANVHWFLGLWRLPLFLHRQI